MIGCFGFMALLDSIVFYIGSTTRKMEKEKRNDRREKKYLKRKKQASSASTDDSRLSYSGSLLLYNIGEGVVFVRGPHRITKRVYYPLAVLLFFVQVLSTINVTTTAAKAAATTACVHNINTCRS